MTITIGIDFRDNNTDVGFINIEPNANYTRELTAVGSDYPVAFGGGNHGWTDNNAIANGRNRDSGVDPRLAGLMFVGAPGTSAFRFDLPDGAGTYSIQLAMGDATAGQTGQQIQVKDGIGGTPLIDISGDTTAGQWIGANNTLYPSSAAWAAANIVNGGGAAQVNVNFATAVCQVLLTATGSACTIAHLFITGPIGGGGPSNIYFDVIFREAQDLWERHRKIWRPGKKFWFPPKPRLAIA